jgi:methylglyoxal synthase
MSKKRFALIAHDRQKANLVEWAHTHLKVLKKQELYATGTTGSLLEKKLGLKIHKFKSGPLGGDLQISAKIVDGKIDYVVFFWDPLAPQPHDVDVKALLRIAVVYNIPIACNPASADLIVSAL